MKKIKLKFLFCFLFVGLFLHQKTANAADIISIDSSFTTNWEFNSNSTGTQQGQDFIANSNNFSKLIIKAGNRAGSGSVLNFHLLNFDNSTEICNETFTGLDLTLNNVSLALDTPCQLNIGEHYSFYLDGSLWAMNGDVYGNNYYANGEIQYTYYNASPGGHNNDYWFQIYYSDTYIPPPQFTIQILTPATTTPFTTYTTQPANYVFEYTNPLNWYPQIRFMVKRQADLYSHAWPDYVNSATYWTISAASTTLVSDSIDFTLPDGNYDLKAEFWANIPASPVIATTTFIINTGGTYGGYSFSTTTEGKLFNPLSDNDMTPAALCGESASTTIGCMIKVALISVVNWAFVPSFDTLQNFKVSYDLWKGCFPFNSYFGITDAILTAASSTATSSTGTIKIPFINNGGNYYMLDVISSTSMSNWVGETNYNLFRTSISYFFWLIAAAIVFFTIKFI